MPFAMMGYPRVAVFKEKVYIGGGMSSDRGEQTVMVYDPQQDSYDTLPPYTHIVKHFSMAVVNNQLVLVGGYNVQTKKETNKLGVWNEQSKQWTHPLPLMTTACSSPSIAAHNTRWLVVIGGYSDGGPLSRVEILDTSLRQWYHGAPLPQPCGDLSLATIGNMCYLLGGFTEGTASKKVFSTCLDALISQAILQPPDSASAPPTPSPWQTLPDTPLIHSTALALNGALLAVGGLASNAIHLYQPSSRSWVKAGELPTVRDVCTCTVLPSGEVFVAGGFGAKQQVDIALVQ